MKVYDSESASVFVYPEKNIVHHQVKKFIFGKEFHEMMMAGTEHYEKNHCSKWLSDDRNNSALRNEDVLWAQEVWEPRILKAGWKAWALVMPEMVVGQMNMAKIVDRYKGMGVVVQAFSDFDKAMAWLEQQ